MPAVRRTRSTSSTGKERSGSPTGTPVMSNSTASTVRLIANVIIANGDPLEVRTAITHVVIAGKDVPLNTRQLELYERYSKRP